jgi:hypothetical protein
MVEVYAPRKTQYALPREAKADARSAVAWQSRVSISERARVQRVCQRLSGVR